MMLFSSDSAYSAMWFRNCFAMWFVRNG